MKAEIHFRYLLMNKASFIQLLVSLNFAMHHLGQYTGDKDRESPCWECIRRHHVQLGSEGNNCMQGLKEVEPETIGREFVTFYFGIDQR